MGLGISPTAGTVAAIFHIFFHALTKPALFISASRLSDVSGDSKKFALLQGSAHRNRLAGAVFTVSSMSMVGIPAFMGFVSKLLFGVAGMKSGVMLVPTLIALAVSTILNVVYYMRTVVRIYTPSSEFADESVIWRMQPEFTGTAVCFIALNILAGLFSQPIVDTIEKGLSIFF